MQDFLVIVWLFQMILVQLFSHNIYEEWIKDFSIITTYYMQRCHIKLQSLKLKGIKIDRFKKYHMNGIKVHWKGFTDWPKKNHNIPWTIFFLSWKQIEWIFSKQIESDCHLMSLEKSDNSSNSIYHCYMVVIPQLEQPWKYYM